MVYWRSVAVLIGSGCLFSSPEICVWPFVLASCPLYVKLDRGWFYWLLITFFWGWFFVYAFRCCLIVVGLFCLILIVHSVFSSLLRLVHVDVSCNKL